MGTTSIDPQKGFLAAYKRDFCHTCCCPGCFNEVVKPGDLVCQNCGRVENRLKATGQGGEASGYLKSWLALPQQRHLQGVHHTNVGQPLSWECFRMDEFVAQQQGMEWVPPPPPLWDAFEKYSVETGNSRLARHGQDRPWFSKMRDFSNSLHASGFVVSDIHADAWPYINQAIFVSDFSDTTCSSCSRPALITHLIGRDHLGVSPPNTIRSSYRTERRLHKGYSMEYWHPVLKLVHPPGLPARPTKLCVKHANQRVNAALMVRTATLRHAMVRIHTQHEPVSISKELGEIIAWHIVYS